MQNIKKVLINGIISESHKEQAKLVEIVIVKLLECSLTILNYKYENKKLSQIRILQNVRNLTHL